MNKTSLIDQILQAQKIAVVLHGPLGIETSITISLPDLRTSPRKVWGDWGPMYLVTLPTDRPIQISAKGPGNSTLSKEILDINHIEIQSPILAKKRANTPLFLELPLASQGLHLRVFYDPLGCVDSVELLPTKNAHPKQKLYTAQLKLNQDNKTSHAVIYTNQQRVHNLLPNDSAGRG